MPKPHRSIFRRVALGLSLALVGLVVVSLLAAGGIALWLRTADLKPILERKASEALERRVTLATFDIRWGDPLSIEFADLRVANASWGSQADMIRIGRFSALLDVSALLRGVLRYERLRIADVGLVLERDAAGVGNWKFGSGGGGGLGLVPKNRTQVPTLIDFAGEDALITYRTRSGNVLKIALDQVAISSPGEATPVRLRAEGAYNDVAVRLDAMTESYAKLRDASEPFGAQFGLAGKDTDIAFDGTFTEPLDFEGARGRLSVEARTLNDILGAMGSKAKANLPLSVAGALQRDGDHWSLSGANGRLMQSDFTGDLALLEGGPGEPDDISLDLDFGALDLDAVTAALGDKKGAPKFDLTPLHPEGLAKFNLSAALKTPNLTVAKRSFHGVALQGRLAGGDATLKELRFAFGGGTVSAAGTLEGDGKDGRLSLQVRLAKAEMAEIAQSLGATGEEIRGRLDGAATLSMQGPTIGTALKSSEGAAVVILRDGDIARSPIEQVSVDLRSLFRSKEGRVPVSCLLGVVTLKDGIGVLSPLRLESREAVVIGAGKVDLTKDRLDLTLKTERDSTNFFALDIPIQVSGPFANLSAGPLPGTDEDWLDRDNSAALAALPPDLRTMASGNACVQ